MTRVFPLPGPATMRSGPSTVVAASRCSSFNSASLAVLFSEAGSGSGQLFSDPIDPVGVLVAFPSFEGLGDRGILGAWRAPAQQDDGAGPVVLEDGVDLAGLDDMGDPPGLLTGLQGPVCAEVLFLAPASGGVFVLEFPEAKEGVFQIVLPLAGTSRPWSGVWVPLAGVSRVFPGCRRGAWETQMLVDGSTGLGMVSSFIQGAVRQVRGLWPDSG